MSKPAKPSLAEQIITLCDDMLRLGREPGSGAGFIVTPRHPSKRPKRKGKASPDVEAVPAVGEYRPRSGPSGLTGRMGQARGRQWDALAAEFDRRAERLAEKVKALDPTRPLDFYAPQPTPCAGDMPEETLRFLRLKAREEGQDEKSSEAVIASIRLGMEGNALRFTATKPQWPGFVVQRGSRRVFISPPEFVEAFDRRFNALKNWAAERARQEGNAKTAEGGKAAGGEGVPDRDERLAKLLIYVQRNPGASERTVAKATGLPASTFRAWPEYRRLRKMHGPDIRKGHKTAEGGVEAYDLG